MFQETDWNDLMWVTVFVVGINPTGCNGGTSAYADAIVALLKKQGWECGASASLDFGHRIDVCCPMFVGRTLCQLTGVYAYRETDVDPWQTVEIVVSYNSEAKPALAFYTGTTGIVGTYSRKVTVDELKEGGIEVVALGNVTINEDGTWERRR